MHLKLVLSRAAAAAAVAALLPDHLDVLAFKLSPTSLIHQHSGGIHSISAGYSSSSSSASD